MLRNSITCLLLLMTMMIAEPALGQGLLDYTIGVNGETRSYDVYVPPRVSEAGARVPLVIVLHGGASNSRFVARSTGFTAKAEREGFIVAYPNGTAPPGRMLLTWNSGHCCTYAMRQRVDDVGFIRAMIDQMVRNLPVDPRRIYVTGISNGAMMAHRVGIELGDRVAAIAPVSGLLFGDERRPVAPVAALIINGALDQHKSLNSAGPFGYPGDGTPPREEAYQAAFWASANGCNPQPREQAPTPAVPITIWRYSCPTGREVVRYLIMDGGHAWPGGTQVWRGQDTASQSVNATDVIWDFFKTHSR